MATPPNPRQDTRGSPHAPSDPTQPGQQLVNVALAAAVTDTHNLPQHNIILGDFNSTQIEQRTSEHDA